MTCRYDFAAVNQAVLCNYPGLLFEWFPNGNVRGNEFQIGNLIGNPGKSLNVNLHSGRWIDNATGESGGDPISLYAAIHGIAQYEAAKRLAETLGASL